MADDGTSSSVLNADASTSPDADARSRQPTRERTATTRQHTALSSIPEKAKGLGDESDDSEFEWGEEEEEDVQLEGEEESKASNEEEPKPAKPINVTLRALAIVQRFRKVGTANQSDMQAIAERAKDLDSAVLLEEGIDLNFLNGWAQQEKRQQQRAKEAAHKLPKKKKKTFTTRLRGMEGVTVERIKVTTNKSDTASSEEEDIASQAESIVSENIGPHSSIVRLINATASAEKNKHLVKEVHHIDFRPHVDDRPAVEHFKAHHRKDVAVATERHLRSKYKTLFAKQQQQQQQQQKRASNPRPPVVLVSELESPTIDPPVSKRSLSTFGQAAQQLVSKTLTTDSISQPHRRVGVSSSSSSGLDVKMHWGRHSSITPSPPEQLRLVAQQQLHSLRRYRSAVASKHWAALDSQANLNQHLQSQSQHSQTARVASRRRSLPRAASGADVSGHTLFSQTATSLLVNFSPLQEIQPFKTVTTAVQQQQLPLYARPPPNKGLFLVKTSKRAHHRPLQLEKDFEQTQDSQIPTAVALTQRAPTSVSTSSRSVLDSPLKLRLLSPSSSAAGSRAGVSRLEKFSLSADSRASSSEVAKRGFGMTIQAETAQMHLEGLAEVDLEVNRPGTAAMSDSLPGSLPGSAGRAVQ
eukprot:CAMPEP_0175139486 /NCGR_PEP_ID=MMETSP0087-20121206/10934_1 /TAXON_ID=136419 /ORGANISM="Unknown Unknown, Strain D1" /LENGTH=639 /DNA_ID=CAMNT_0016422511 /DNA_START=226 /DNA_END=2145 /DNA_ORIENTATION=-